MGKACMKGNGGDIGVEQRKERPSKKSIQAGNIPPADKEKEKEEQQEQKPLERDEEEEDTPGGWDFGPNYNNLAAEENGNNGQNKQEPEQQQPAADNQQEEENEDNQPVVDREWDKKFKDWQLG